MSSKKICQWRQQADQIGPNFAECVASVERREGKNCDTVTSKNAEKIEQSNDKSFDHPIVSDVIDVLPSSNGIQRASAHNS